jgi:phage terminase large subunit-like protein
MAKKAATARQPSPTKQTNKDQVEQYIDEVLRGKKVAGKLIKAACQRHRDDLKNAKRKGIYFDEHEANRAINFTRLLKHSDGEWAGRPFELRPHQKFIFWVLFGWRRASDGMRRFLRAFISEASGNGKSPIGAMILLLCTFFDFPPEPRAEGYIISTKKSQCKPVFDEIKGFRAQDPDLQEMLVAMADNINCPMTQSKIEKLGSEGTVDDGLKPHCVVYDEIHRAREHHRETLEMIKSKMGKRRQPLMVTITTAGNDMSNLWEEEYDTARKVVERGNGIEADDLFVFIAQIDDDDDPLDERNWPKANPMLEHGVVKIHQLRAQASTARISPKAKKDFIRLRMNRKVTSDVKPITSEMWATGNLALPDLEGRQSHAGFDWGFKDDLTAMAYAFVLDPVEIGGAEKRRVAVLCDVWIPADGPRNLAEEPWASWITDGFISVTPGAITDTENIYATIAERQKEFGIATVAFDGNNAREFGSRIITDYGITAFPHGQGFSKMNEPTRELLDMLHEGRLIHGGNPVLAWAALNLVLQTNPSGYVRPVKGRAKDKIDPIVAVIMAINEVMFAEREPVLNYYETHDVEAG